MEAGLLGAQSFVPEVNLGRAVEIKAKFFDRHSCESSLRNLEVETQFFINQIIDVHGGTWGDVTYYILAAQTIYFKYYFNKSSFCRSSEISGSLTPRQSIKVLASLICPQHKNQCKTQWELQAMLTLRVRFAWIQHQVKSKPFKSIAVSTRVRLSGSVEISNLTTALHLQRNQFQSERLSSI